VKISGAEIFVRSLIEEGVDTLFGYPGGAVLNIYDELYKHADQLKHVLGRHEQASVHAADGYARSTGKVGTALVTSGPGATNAVTGIATAYMDSIPLVVFTGQVPTALIGNDAFQEADIVGITRPCTKHNFLVQRTEDLAMTIKKAYYLAASGRPGPVVVDIPKDVTINKAEFDYPKEIRLRSYNPTVKGHPGQIRRAAKMIAKAKRPLFYTGGGVILSNACDELTALVRRLGYPITQTLMGLGAVPASDPSFLGMLGMHGTFEANMAVSQCDLLIAIGARFDDRVTGKIEAFAPDADIIHIDIDPSSISKNVRVDLPIVGDVKAVLTDMLDYIDRHDLDVEHREAIEGWWAEIEEWRARKCLSYTQNDTTIKPQYVIERLHALTNGQAYVTTEVGQHQMWAAQFYGFEQPRRWMTSGGLGTMGYGFPAAMGAQVAHPEATVIDIAGEASIQMNIQELATAMQYRLPVKIAILNNSYLGMVRQWQELFYGNRYSESDMSVQPDFVKLAEAYGAAGFRARTPAEVDAVIKQALEIRDRPVIMDFITDREENVYPMVPAGAALKEMILI